LAWPEDSCFTVEQSARFLGRHPEQVRRYLREGRFRGAIKLGLMWYIPRPELAAFAARLRARAVRSKRGPR
jgi:hypothetical protein